MDTWATSLGSAIEPHISDQTYNELRNTEFRYIEDSLSFLLEKTDMKSIVCAAVEWVQSAELCVFHGTRLTDVEVEGMSREGLLPLDHQKRRQRLVRALSSHPKWSENIARFDQILADVGPGMSRGDRLGQVHLTLSCYALEEDFNHYRQFGSEFDLCVAEELFGDDGAALLAKDGSSRTVRLELPGSEALSAANRFFPVAELNFETELPNIVRQFLLAWSYSLGDETFRPCEMKVDCGLIFYSSVPADWIVEIT